MDKKDAITYGLIGGLVYLLTRSKKFDREATIDEILRLCELQVEGCDAERPILEGMNDEQLKYLLKHLQDRISAQG